MLQLGEEIKNLQMREKELDQHKMWIQQSIQNITDDTANHPYLFSRTLLPRLGAIHL